MIRVQQVSHADAHVAIHDVRQRVFVQEQGIAAELERDALDPVSAHVLAQDADGQPVACGGSPVHAAAVLPVPGPPAAARPISTPR